MKDSRALIIPPYTDAAFADGSKQTTADRSNSSIDYSKAKHWLALPSPDNIGKQADVFYLYPTVFRRAGNDAPFIAGIDNAGMLTGSKRVLNIQATAFETIANIYAPYYRQVDAAYFFSLPPEQQNKIIEGIPTSDVFAAFDYYIKNFNNGRPFILAGHSQGSNLLLYLLSDYMKLNPVVYKRMIAAYVIGYSVTTDFLAANPHLKFANDADETGVIISYNTEAPGCTTANPVLLPNSNIINPITWTREETPASASQNLGSLNIHPTKLIIDSVSIPGIADATVNRKRGVVVCGTVDINKFSWPAVSKGVYHTSDYPFYFFNIRANAENRVKNYLNKQNR